jgi:hypothetical protein
MRSFIVRAEAFLQDQSVLTKKEVKHSDEMVETVRFLLDHAIGRSNAISTKKIIEHLESKGFVTYREGWQVNVLGPLRKHGIFIAANKSKGMYFIQTDSDAKSAIKTIQDRIDEEKVRLEILKEMCRDAGLNID